MDVSPTSPFMTLGAAGYAPYPLHTPFGTVILPNRNSRHRRNTSTPSQSQSRASGSSHRRTQSATVPSAPRNPISQNRRCSIYSPPGQLCVRPRRPERIDSGFEDDDGDDDDKSETSSVTFTFADEVERQFALRQFLGQRDCGSGETAYEREDEREESGYESGYESEEGEVGQ
ncbi:hypothetical protein E8E13_008544 [Curvularia kusanoi]|uniref:Uncharacterized protein n=1 Tax=Curvularia kusanoi TaxID=90978 RepID=A0A9P4W7G9_CURKU|nr:hypothetical protein E8E13_008544 [Curvularia kusanoi]